MTLMGTSTLQRRQWVWDKMSATAVGFDETGTVCIGQDVCDWSQCGKGQCAALARMSATAVGVANRDVFLQNAESCVGLVEIRAIPTLVNSGAESDFGVVQPLQL